MFRTVSLVSHLHDSQSPVELSAFSVPFDEEEKEKDVWFLDHEYLENMYTMFRKVNGKQRTGNERSVMVFL